MLAPKVNVLYKRHSVYDVLLKKIKMNIQLYVLLVFCYSWSNSPKIECSENGCAGTYFGPEFINGSDVAHQFSNRMSGAVGDKLKELYAQNKYAIVDFTNIEMSTNGMGSGKVEYALSIPFITVQEKCDAYTSFDHVGGWNHSPALSSRKKQLSNALLKGGQLDISELKTTPEGLQEYWIQWKNKLIQSSCENGSFSGQ